MTHALWALHAQGFDVWFKGGTSLSKGFGLIERFWGPRLSLEDACTDLREWITAELGA